MPFTHYRSNYLPLWYLYCSEWQRFSSILSLLRHQNNLSGLIQWANRKRLKKVRQYYERLLNDIESRLLRYTFQSPRMTEFARWIFCFQQMLFPPRYRKGYGMTYRRRQ